MLVRSKLEGPGKSTALLSATAFPLHFPLSAPMSMLRFPLHCYISVLPAGGEGGVSRWKLKVRWR